jgi:hypothetical protein
MSTYEIVRLMRLFSLSKNKRSLMKLYIVFFALALFTLFQNNAFSQEIPNAGFENWTNGEPDTWLTSNVMGIGTPVTQSSDSHSGSSAIKLGVVSTIGGNYPGSIWSAGGPLNGFPVSQAHGSLMGYYKFNRAGDDILYVSVLMQKNQVYIGGGITTINTSMGNYTQFVVPIDYIGSEVPDSASIQISISDSVDGMVSLETYALIDDLAFGSAVSVDNKMQAVQTFSLKQNYPNPFNPSTTIEYSVPQESFVNLTVYDILGNKVADLVNNARSAGTYKADFNASNLSSGIYIARMNATSNDGIIRFTKSYKMTLVK